MCSFFMTNRSVSNIDFINEFIKYRGPDNTNVVQANGYLFLHNLLSITGSFTIQPMIQDDVYCLFNGEIYNYRDLGGYDNDSKCIIPLYKKYGMDFVDQLDGEYAIVLVDFRANLMIFATDAFSTKPFWYAFEGAEVGVSSYESALLRSGFKRPVKLDANTVFVFDLGSFNLIRHRHTVEFDIINQYKGTYDDWTEAFSKAIRKRTDGVREKIFIGLSSGYDSGSIACELIEMGVPFKSYSQINTENREVLRDRITRMKSNSEAMMYILNSPGWQTAHDFIKTCVEDFTYRTYSAASFYQEFTLSIHDDNGSNHLSFVCSLAKADNRKIYLSGSGADELFSDYGFNGQPKYPHSSFGGKFPDDLTVIFPWPSFFGSSMVSYLVKEEYIAGAYGLEARYPYLDPAVVQEFLWLRADLKNRWYKSVLHNYMTDRHFPFDEGRKIGF